MARFNYELTIEKIEKFKAEGRGIGEFENYKPWLTVRDFPSKGRSSREKGVKVKREYHFLSDLERYFFYITEWDDNVVNIREQFPVLDRSKTMEIAEILGYQHPRSNTTKVNAVITADFLVTYKKTDGELTTVARSIKPHKELQKKRTLEKLIIEKYYFESIGIDWAVITEKEIDRNLAVNIQELRDYLLHPYNVDEEILSYLYESILETNPNEKVVDTIANLAEISNISETILLNALKILIVSKRLRANLSLRLNFNKQWKKFLEA